MPTKDELRAIIAATSDQHRPLILTALLAGLQNCGRHRGLTWDSKSISSRRKSTFASGPIAITGSGRRNPRPEPARIPMSPLLLNTLKAWQLT